ncbi:MAG: VIT1/CCC1 transporter family protein [Brevinematales bacterium]
MENKDYRILLDVQRNEITEYLVYKRLAAMVDEKNASILSQIAEAERCHALYWQNKTGIEVSPKRIKVFFRILLANILGMTFVLKLMERNEGTGSKRYAKLAALFPEAGKMAAEEEMHEKELLCMLDEEKLRYVGSIVLGLNDALVELTGALAGFTLALRDTKLISIAGLVTGVSAAFSMAASNYLASKTEGEKLPLKAAFYTGSAYIFTVFLMILPYLLLNNSFLSLGVMILVVIGIIGLFNYYISVARDLAFKQRFFEMSLVSLGVATFSFCLGWVLKVFFGVDG